jgi:hypothetical protein
MTLHATWVHGITVRPEWVGDNLQKVHGDRWDGTAGDVPWSDVNGLPRGWGVTFRGKHSLAVGFGGATTTGPFDPGNPFQYSQKGYWFHCAVPTPVVVSDRRSRLLRVFVLWEAGDGVAPVAVHVYDGLRRVAALPVAAGARGLIGRGGLGDLQDGVTRFNLGAPHEVLWSVGISVGVSFDREGEITFVSAGADFDT